MALEKEKKLRREVGSMGEKVQLLQHDLSQAIVTVEQQHAQLTVVHLASDGSQNIRGQQETIIVTQASEIGRQRAEIVDHQGRREEQEGVVRQLRAQGEAQSARVESLQEDVEEKKRQAGARRKDLEKKSLELERCRQRLNEATATVQSLNARVSTEAATATVCATLAQSLAGVSHDSTAMGDLDMTRYGKESCVSIIVYSLYTLYIILYPLYTL